MTCGLPCAWYSSISAYQQTSACVPYLVPAGRLLVCPNACQGLPLACCLLSAPAGGWHSPRLWSRVPLLPPSRAPMHTLRLCCCACAWLQFVSTRQLTANTSGEYSWVVGPPEAAGMSLGLTRRTEKLMLSARVEVGAMTALVLRGARQLSSAATARLGLKLTPVGVEFDLGGTKRFSEVATAGCGVAVGLQVGLVRGFGRVRGTRGSGGAQLLLLLPAAASFLSAWPGAWLLCPGACFSRPGTTVPCVSALSPGLLRMSVLGLGLDLQDAQASPLPVQLNPRRPSPLPLLAGCRASH